MIVHLVLFRPRADADARALIGAFENALTGIPLIRRARVGKRITIGREYEQLMTADYTHAAVLEFDDAPSLKAYLEHPAHQELGTRLFQSIEAVLVYDFDVTEGSDGLAALVPVEAT
jgi:hypothetical protein